MNGYGISGVITPQLSFAVPTCEYGDTSGLFPAGAQVILTCSNGMDIPRFYISSRSYSGAKLNFTCYDRTYTTDREIIVPDSLFDSEGYCTIGDVMDKIMAVCGFSGYSDSSGMIGSVITRGKKDDIQGKTCRNILDELSCVCGGIWTVQGDEGSAEVRGTLVLIAVDKGMGAVFTAEKYSDIYVGGTKTFDKIVLNNGTSSYTAGASSSAFGTLEIETHYASAEAAGALYNRLRDYTYTAWSCEKMLTDIIPVPSSLITFGSKSNLYVNNCALSLTSTGIYASAGRNFVSEDELAYHNRTERELALRYRIGALMGNTKLAPNGLTIVVEDKVNGKTEEYGFNAMAGGITEFTGSILNSIQPTGKFLTDTDGNECFRANYNGKQYDYGYSEDSEGNITLFKNEVTDSG